MVPDRGRGVDGEGEMKFCTHCAGWGVEPGKPPAEKSKRHRNDDCGSFGCSECTHYVTAPPRLTIEVHTGALGAAFANVRLDGDAIRYFERYSSEPEARAAAQAYVDELLKHFRSGGE
jgi:hypothetical protein